MREISWLESVAKGQTGLNTQELPCLAFTGGCGLTQQRLAMTSLTAKGKRFLLAAACTLLM